MKGERIKMETKNRVYQIYELRDEIKKALKNIDFIESQEKLLVSILISSPQHESFKDFIKGTQKNWENYETQRIDLNERLKRLEKIISLREENKENRQLIDEIVSLTLEGTGSAKPEKKK